MNICVIGNSKRSSLLAENLKKYGYSVRHITDGMFLSSIIESDYIVLPIPTLLPNGCINIENSKKEIEKYFSKNSIIIGYNFHCETNKTVDLSLREDFAYLNAIPTAEGAIATALNNSDTSLFYSKILITGFGRVSKILADRLLGLKCKVTIAARSDRDLSLATALGYDAMHIKDLENTIENFDIVFQTVPSLILSQNLLKKMNKNTLIIELSSKSVGTDTNFAKTNGNNLINAAALPEKVSPNTAANILTLCVLKIINETSD